MAKQDLDALIARMTGEPQRTSTLPMIPMPPGVPGATKAGLNKIIVNFSGGKDSVACVLHLLELGVPKHAIELWHQEIDEPGDPFMDWPSTPAYCRAFADAMGLDLFFQRRVGGFRRELMRDNDVPGSVTYDLVGGGERTLHTKRKKGLTRHKFPFTGAIESGRWCSAILKIDVEARVINDDPRFNSGTFLSITGERRQESTPRSNYQEVNAHRTNKPSRTVTRWHTVLEYPEEEVWAIMRRFGVVPHPAYQLGWGRLSCMSCVFGDKHQWVSVRQIAPDAFDEIVQLERSFGYSIKPRTEGFIPEFIVKRTKKFPLAGVSFIPSGTKRIVRRAMSAAPWRDKIVVSPSRWSLPEGAYKGGGGPS